MRQANIIVKTSVRNQADFIGQTLEKGLIAIDAEGQQIQDDVIVSGLKICDGNTVWDNIPYLKLSPEVAKAWKDLAESATNGQLVSLPDLNFAYLLIDAEKIDNAQYTEIVNQIAANNIGLYLSSQEDNTGNYTLFINSNKDKPFIAQDSIGEKVDQKTISKLTFNSNKDSKYDSMTISFKDAAATKEISNLKTTDNNLSKELKDLTSIVNSKAAQTTIEELTKILFNRSDLPADVKGLLPMPGPTENDEDHYLTGKGTWKKLQINLTAESIAYNDTTVAQVLNNLLDGTSLNCAKGTSTDTTVYVLGISENDINNKKVTLKYSSEVYLDCKDNVLYGGAWNDIAEFRESFDNYLAGTCVCETVQGKLVLTANRMIPNSYIVSDTYGYALGDKEVGTVPVAIAGRVLAYCWDSDEKLKIGDAVCSGPNGGISKMKTWEKILHPECIIGYVSEIPQYEIWGQHNTSVRGRVWIRVK